jgi:uncharacterized membrane protein YdjX (TVP38/TMEM64 family)
MGHSQILHLLNWISAQGFWGGLCLVLLYAVACLTFLPGSMLTLGAGALYGFVTGVALISAGSLLGATCSFLIGRYLLRGFLQRKLAQNAKFQAIDQAIAQEGWKIVLLSRLSPIFPFSLLNYGLGLTRISLGHFMVASWLGTLPLIAVYVYAGMLAGSLVRIDQAHQSSTTEWILKIVGLVATIALSIYTTRVATKALEKFKV